MIFVSLGDQHHHGMRQRTAAHDEHLESVIEHGRIASTFNNHRQEVLNILTEQLRGKLRLTSFHPVFVSEQSIDLAVVRYVSEGVRERPARKGVCRESLMYDGQRGLYPFVGKVRKVHC